MSLKCARTGEPSLEDRLLALFKELINSPRNFTIEGATYASLFAQAEAISEAVLSYKEPLVILAEEDRPFIAAALLSSLVSGFKIVLPYSLSAAGIQEAALRAGASSFLSSESRFDLKGLECLKIARKGACKIKLPEKLCDLNETFLFLFTGGSTGKPALWPKTPANLFCEAFYLKEKFGVTSRDTFLATVPPIHIYGLLFSVLLPLTAGAKTVNNTPAFPAEIEAAFNGINPAFFVSVPAHYRALKDYKILADRLKIAFSSAGMLEEEDGKSFLEKTGIAPIEVYGSTETGGCAFRSRAVGKEIWTPFERAKWKILGGRLAISSPFISAELERDEEGFYLTGDLAESAGKEGFILLGRADGIVKVGGKRVSLLDVENKIKDIKGVEDAFVFAATARNGRGTEISALVKGKIALSDLKGELLSKLEPYAMPKRIKIATEIPLTATGKRSREDIEELFKGNTQKGNK